MVAIQAERLQAITNALDFTTAEMLAIHAACDGVEVPREVDGERLSAAQRVTVLVGAYKSACVRVIKG